MIQIAQKLCPYSHVAGVTCVIPGTCSEVIVYPTLLSIEGHSIPLPIQGPVQPFTVEQDLEKNCIRVFGKGKDGYFRLKITGKEGGFDIIAEKGPSFSQFFPFATRFKENALCEKLSLGNHKAQDWDFVQRRCDPREFLPALFCLGQKIPFIAPQPLSGTARLLELPPSRSDLYSSLQLFFMAAFKGILSPRLIDDQHQGICCKEEVAGDRFFLLQEGAKMVRSLFFQQIERRLQFLPRLPIPLDCGRMTGLKAPGIGTIDLEWSKKTLRRVNIHADTPGDVLLDLPKGIRQFRVRKSAKERGRILQATDAVVLEEAPRLYLIDRFVC